MVRVEVVKAEDKKKKRVLTEVDVEESESRDRNEDMGRREHLLLKEIRKKAVPQ